MEEQLAQMSKNSVLVTAQVYIQISLEPQRNIMSGHLERI